MRAIIITAFCALCLSLVPLHAATEKADTLNVMKIDDQAYETFDGKELEGKTIVTYNTSVCTIVFDGQEQLVKLHLIKTSDYTAPMPEIYFIDDKEVDKDAIDRLKPHQIESVIVNKIDGTIRVFLKKG